MIIDDESSLMTLHIKTKRPMVETTLGFGQPDLGLSLSHFHTSQNRETHGGDDVGIWAIGPWSHLIHGVHQQSYIAHLLR